MDSHSSRIRYTCNTCTQSSTPQELEQAAFPTDIRHINGPPLLTDTFAPTQTSLRSRTPFAGVYCGWAPRPSRHVWTPQLRPKWD